MYKYFKRFMDFTLSLLLFIFISPLFIVISIMVRIKLGKPIFFKQTRTGYNMKKFNMIKFRTMTDRKGENGELLPDEERMTKFGSFLRTSSLDELPELLHIIKGEMSSIGPRPLPTIYDDYYTDEEKKRFQVRGGLIPSNNCEKKGPITNWDEQLKYEVNYVKTLCFKNDLNIFFKVFDNIFHRSKTNYGDYVRKPLNVERKEKTIKIHT